MAEREREREREIEREREKSVLSALLDDDDADDNNYDAIIEASKKFGLCSMLVYHELFVFSNNILIKEDGEFNYINKFI